MKFIKKYKKSMKKKKFLMYSIFIISFIFLIFLITFFYAKIGQYWYDINYQPKILENQTTKLRANPNLKIGDCWKEERYVQDVKFINGLYNIIWTSGCPCSIINKAGGDINLYFYSQNLSYKEVKTYANSVLLMIKNVDPFKSYTYTAYYESQPLECRKIMKEGRKDIRFGLIGDLSQAGSSPIGIGTFGYYDKAAQVYFNFNDKYMRNKINVIHEIGHAYTLKHVVCEEYVKITNTSPTWVKDPKTGQYVFIKDPKVGEYVFVKYKENCNNYMMSAGTGSTFLDWQKQIIKDIINSGITEAKSK